MVHLIADDCDGGNNDDHTFLSTGALTNSKLDGATDRSKALHWHRIASKITIYYYQCQWAASEIYARLRAEPLIIALNNDGDLPTKLIANERYPISDRINT